MKIERLLKVRGHVGQDKQMSLLMHMLSHTSVGDQCWDWKGATGRANYGMLRIDSKPYVVTRLVANLTFGLDLERKDLFVCHSCDNPRCINPRHLFIGTQSDNLADMMKKKRHHTQRRAVPTERDLRMLALIDSGTSVKKAAEAVGISRNYAATILSILVPYWKLTGQLPKSRKAKT